MDITDFVKIIETHDKGRSMISLKTFKPGDTILVEDPLVSHQFSWNRLYKYLACDHCMRPLETTEENIRRLASDSNIILPYPEYCPTKEWLKKHTECPSCKIKYCSEDCYVNAINQYHKVSCLGQSRFNPEHPINILEKKWQNIHYPPEYGTIMLIVRILAMYQQDKPNNNFFEKLQSFQNMTYNSDLKIHHKMFREIFKFQFEDLYKAYYNAFNLADFKDFIQPNNFQSLMALIGTNSQGVATSPFSQWVQLVSNLNLSTDKKLELETFIDDVYKKMDEFSGEFLNAEGCALYELQSKINHSCIPNAQTTFPYSNNRLELKCLKEINPGEEIFVSYLSSCDLERGRHSRQKLLKENYLFICKCQKCENQINDSSSTSGSDEEESDLSDMSE